MAVLLALLEVFLFVIGCTAEEPMNTVQDHCLAPGDVVFLIDESNSIGHEDFLKQLQFVNKVITHFQMTRDDVHIGVMSFGSDVTNIIQLGDYLYREEELRRRVLAYSDERGRYNEYTRTDLALDHCRTTMYHHGRYWVPHIAIIITDGDPNVPHHTDSDARRVTAWYADQLKRDGVTVFAIGVGWKVNQTQLMEMASGRGRDYVHMVNSYSVLGNIEWEMSKKFCYVMMQGAGAAPGNSWPSNSINEDQIDDQNSA